jgi:hypothetical protein
MHTCTILNHSCRIRGGQVGEALQIHSGGLLMATPHYVRTAVGPGAAGVSRSTFAVFMQPGVKEPMDVPPGGEGGGGVVGVWQCFFFVMPARS